jgi:hypothetical protein
MECRVKAGKAGADDDGIILKRFFYLRRTIYGKLHRITSVGILWKLREALKTQGLSMCTYYSTCAL